MLRRSSKRIGLRVCDPTPNQHYFAGAAAVVICFVSSFLSFSCAAAAATVTTHHICIDECVVWRRRRADVRRRRKYRRRRRRRRWCVCENALQRETQQRKVWRLLDKFASRTYSIEWRIVAVAANEYTSEFVNSTEYSMLARSSSTSYFRRRRRHTLQTPTDCECVPFLASLENIAITIYPKGKTNTIRHRTTVGFVLVFNASRDWQWVVAVLTHRIFLVVCIKNIKWIDMMSVKHTMLSNMHDL